MCEEAHDHRKPGDAAFAKYRSELLAGEEVDLELDRIGEVVCDPVLLVRPARCDDAVVELLRVPQL